jgi:hypothetical protein
MHVTALADSSDTYLKMHINDKPRHKGLQAPDSAGKGLITSSTTTSNSMTTNSTRSHNGLLNILAEQSSGQKEKGTTKKDENAGGDHAVQSGSGHRSNEHNGRRLLPSEEAGRDLAASASKGKRQRARRPNGDELVPKHTLICGNCTNTGHSVQDCSRNLDDEGFVNACPFCNTNKHNAMRCPLVPGRKLSQLYHYFVRCRAGKAPLRGPWNFCEIDPVQ